MVEITFVLKVMLYQGYSRVFRVGGRVTGKAEIITNSAQLGLELGLRLAISILVNSKRTILYGVNNVNIFYLSVHNFCGF